MTELRSYIRDGAEIYRNSFAIIRAEANLSRFEPNEEKLVVRIIHACGMVDIADDVLMSPTFAASASEALLRGAPILCDAKMVAHGITRSRLPSQQRRHLHARRSEPWRSSQPRLETPDRRRRWSFGGRIWRELMSPSAMRRPRCFGCSKCSTKARRFLPPSSAFPSVLSGPPNPSRPSRRRPAFHSLLSVAAGAVAPWPWRRSTRWRVSANDRILTQSVERRPGGTLYGIGVGPGDVSYLTLRAAALVRDVDVIAFFAKRGLQGNARGIVDPLIGADRHELRLEYPVTNEIPPEDPSYQTQIGRFYEESAAALSALLRQGKSVGLLAEGDPFFYGSFMHMWRRLDKVFPGRGRSRRNGHVGLLDARQCADHLGQRHPLGIAGDLGRGAIDAPPRRHRRCRHHEGRQQPRKGPPRRRRRPDCSRARSMSSAAPCEVSRSCRCPKGPMATALTFRWC